MPKLPLLNDRKRAHIVNMGSFTIAQHRGFGAAEIPIFETLSVYVQKLIIFLTKASFERGLLIEILSSE